MHCFATCRASWLVVSTILSFTYISTVNANSSPNQTVDWIWPAVPKDQANPPIYNTIDTINASWTSNLDFDPYLIVWCMAPGGWVANQSGSVPPSGWHLVPLNLGIEAPYPLGCHLAFDDMNHHALQIPTGNSGNFNISDATDSNPKIVGQSTSKAAATASATASKTGATPGATTVVVNAPLASSDISTGAIVGIVIGALLGVGSVLGALLYLCFRKRKRDRQRRNDAERTSTIGDDKSAAICESQAFMVGEMAADPTPTAELVAATEPVLEKDGEQQRAELGTERVGEAEGAPVEMEGSGGFGGGWGRKDLKRWDEGRYNR